MDFNDFKFCFTVVARNLNLEVSPNVLHKFEHFILLIWPYRVLT